MATPYPKQPMHRFAYTKLSESQIAAQLNPAAARGPASASPLSDAFAGKTLKIVTDKGPTLTYKFNEHQPADRRRERRQGGAGRLRRADAR